MYGKENLRPISWDMVVLDCTGGSSNEMYGAIRVYGDWTELIIVEYKAEYKLSCW